MKKIRNIILLAVLLASIFACDNYDETPTDDAQVLISTSYILPEPVELSDEEREILSATEDEYNEAMSKTK